MFIRFHGKRHPETMGAEKVAGYLTWLATDRNVAAATQNQALHAILFLYKQVLGKELPWLDGYEWSWQFVFPPENRSHESIETTMIHTHVTNKVARGPALTPP